MAVVRRTLANSSSPIRYPNVGNDGTTRGRVETVEGTPPRVIENMIYVAVGNNLKESEMTLKWALHNSGGSKICILHVHQPADKMPIMGAKVRISEFDERQVREFHERERQNMHQLLEMYSLICQKAGVRAEKLHIEKDSIQKGIVELIVQHSIRKLVMGAAADKSYSRKMTELKSKKAIYVRLQAPASCHIFFICKGHVIYTREGRVDELNVGGSSPLLQASSISETGHSGTLRSRSVVVGHNNQLGSPAPDHRRVMSDALTMNLSAFSSPDRHGITASPSRFSSSSSYVGYDSTPDCSIEQQREIELDQNRVPYFKEDLHPHLSPPSVLQGGGVNDELYDQLVQAMAEVDCSRQDAYEESIKRRKAEKSTLEAMRGVKALESSYMEESRRKRELEEALARVKHEHEKNKQQLDKVMDELRIALEHKSSLEGQIANSMQLVTEMEQKMFSAVELLQHYKKERDEFLVERDDALRVAELLREKQAEEVSSSRLNQSYTELSFSEIEDATNYFDKESKIGEGGYGSVYKGFLRHTQVAVKKPNSDSMQGPSEFQQEVNVLGKLRHPNLIALVGACPEACILVYEYLSGGSLEDRLSCKHNTPPLSWQTRIRIATELCSVLIFIHSHSIVHGDLKPANVLLDGNLVSKLSDFGICRKLSKSEYSKKYTTLCCLTDPKSTFAYMDPEFMSTGELTSKSDVYSFGIILLMLLTGKPPMGLQNIVQNALDLGNLNRILDSTAGNWPYIQAEQLAYLGLKCCEQSRRNHPSLGSHAWRVLEPMRVSSGVSSFRLRSEEDGPAPHYFMCPIFQEIMQEPVIAADGFTYEAEAIRRWWESGHNTYPMTNDELPNSNLTPNHALQSAIKEWLRRKF